ncbi:DUF2752 domain-containing protein [Aureibaculum sp. 2210JD6-5]|uniref:DUF2752 domain-containing protein n=1 Tax=Aureibaculum sp. 2210JD6-5 TaxID=3103957 RepID=UPI002ABD84A6|nr:DUF2752 domain-containing protein [Aureibaculum sp. 2210JD6-5]
MLLLLVVTALFYFSINPNRVDFLLKCPLYSTTGIFCPGCGSQRGFHNLLHGNILAALQNNILLVLGLIGLLYHYGIQFSNHLFKTTFKSFFDNKKAVYFVIVLLLLFWIVRNIPMSPFNLLAPTN